MGGLSLKKSVSRLSDDPSPSADEATSDWKRDSTMTCPSFGLADSKLGPAAVALYKPNWGPIAPDCGPLNMKLVPPNLKRAMKASKTQRLQTSPIIRNSFGTVRCFGATHRATTTHLSRGCQDLPTQLYHWDFYKTAVKALHLPRGKFLNPNFAEFMTGLPENWTLAEPRAVSHKNFLKWFPHVAMDQGAAPKMKGISLFSGIAALELGLSEFISPMVYVEKSHECQEILECRMRDGMIPQGRLVSDVCGYTPDAETQRLATALTGGFPCQGASVAGACLGLDDQRTALVKEVFAIIDKCPHMKLVLLENVKNILSPSLRSLWNYVIEALLRRGFRVRWCVVSGRNVGFHVNRQRVFIMATRGSYARDFFQDAKLMTEAEIHAEANKCHNLRNRPCVSQWLIQSHDKQDASRLHAVGNMVLPKCAALAFHLMAAADREDAD